MSQMPALQHPDPPRFGALEALSLTAACRAGALQRPERRKETRTVPESGGYRPDRWAYLQLGYEHRGGEWSGRGAKHS